jgi:hypothetical protein
MTQQLELDLEVPNAPPAPLVQLSEAPSPARAVVLPFRRPVASLEEVRARENDARVKADLELVRLFM